METVIRVVLIYLVLLIGFRIMGKREFSQLSPLELVTLILIPEIVGQAIVREDFSFTNAMIGVTTLFSIVFLSTLTQYLNPDVQKLIVGTPSLLVHHGKFIEENMHKERVDADEIFNEMHKVGLYELAQVKWAILETDGKISLIPEEDQSPALRRKPYDKESSL